MEQILYEKYKPKLIEDLIIDDMIKTKLNNINENIMLVSNNNHGVGKCFAKGTQVLAFNNFKYIEDIEIGDLILTSNGNPKRVISITSGEDIMYEVKQSNFNSYDFSSYIVNSHHILCLINKKTRKLLDINILEY